MHELVRNADWLTHTLAALGKSTRGDGIEVERIGAGFGLSGEIYRLRFVSRDEKPETVVLKLEQLDKHHRAVAALEQVSHCLKRQVPTKIGEMEIDGVGVLFLEDVSPATQGDDLVSCSEAGAERIVQTIARLHGCEIHPTIHMETWKPRMSEAEAWQSRLVRAHDRYPKVVTQAAVDRLVQFPFEVERAGHRLTNSTPCLIHVDPHLDNVLWRPDGSPVLLDWSNARIGPSAIDIAALLVGYAFRDDPSMSPDDLIGIYADHRGLDPGNVRGEAVDGLKPFIQGIIGWAGEISNQGFDTRKKKLRDSTVPRAIRALEFIDAV